MEPESSLPQSQVPATCLCPEPAQSSPYHHILLQGSQNRKGITTARCVITQKNVVPIYFAAEAGNHTFLACFFNASVPTVMLCNAVFGPKVTPLSDLHLPWLSCRTFLNQISCTVFPHERWLWKLYPWPRAYFELSVVVPIVWTICGM
jgi:hypothetical protein